ncbi:homocysteine synthase, partial [Exaiptasia diaphana]|uniref:O-acetylhomoserine aminocarboxypropyltransferase n=1 Tax=Exaiptasia diaphana TaxID=2652724 RepID=A0A913XKI6_EXADI
MKRETSILHAGQRFDPTTGAISAPIYQSSAFAFESVDQAANVFDLKEPGRTYSRLMNPTNDIFESRIASFEGGVGALSTSSGQAAITYAILNIAEAGDNIVSSNRLYGGTWHLLAHTMRRLGIETRFVNPDAPNDFLEASDEKTKCFFLEGIPNPMLTPIPVREIAEISRSLGLPTIVDNTITPYIASPFNLGVDIVVYSTTKFIGGHGNTIGGCVVDSGNFDWEKNQDRFPLMCEPDPSHGNILWLDAAKELGGEYGQSPYLLKMRNTIQRDIGACPSPFSSFLLLQGLETLPMRMKKHCENAA